MLTGSASLSGILAGSLLGRALAGTLQRTSPQPKLTFDSTGSLNFFFNKPLNSISPSRLFVKVKGIFLSDGLLFTLDTTDILIYVSDLSRLNIKVKSGSSFTALNSPIALNGKVTFSLEIVDRSLTLKVQDKSLTKTLPEPLTMSSVRNFYLSGAPNVSDLGLNALKAQYDYVWVNDKVYTKQDLVS